MHYLLIAATHKEIAPFLKSMAKRNSSLSPATRIDILVTGIGLMATTYSLARQLWLTSPDLVVQAGVAGGFKDRVQPGDLVVVEKDCIADQSVVELEKLKTIFDLKLAPASQPPYKNGWLQNPHKEIIRSTGLKKVNGISVNQITHSPRQTRFYQDKFNPSTESMEGAALHYTCLQENIPFLQVRAISNFIGERDKKKWDMKDSIHSLNQFLESFLLQ